MGGVVGGGDEVEGEVDVKFYSFHVSDSLLLKPEVASTGHE